MKYPMIHQADLSGKNVLLRAGFDMQIENGVVQDTTRIRANLKTMRYILDHGAALIIMSHQGRPKPPERDPAFSQLPVVPVLEQLLQTAVHFAERATGPATKALAQGLKPGEVLLLENLRYEEGETSKDPAVRDALGRELAALADIYVNDAFTNCHRDHASMTSVPKYIPGFIGLTVEEEIAGLSKATENPTRPVTLIISGLKMETKVPVIQRFLNHGDDILVGGGVANTFLRAKGLSVGTSKYDTEFVDLATQLLEASGTKNLAKVHVPADAIVAAEPKDDARAFTVSSDAIDDGLAIYDIGPATVAQYARVIAKSGTIVWNGPLGFYECEQFAEASKRIAEAIALATELGAVSVVGGGDTLDFHDKYDYPKSCYTYVSTAGGAMLDFISGKPLPALEALKN